MAFPPVITDVVQTGTRNNKVARSYEGKHVHFDKNYGDAPAKAFTSTNVQEAIVEAKSAPALDVWDPLDNGALTPSQLHEWATKRFYTLQRQATPGATGGGSVVKGWMYRPWTNVVSDLALLPDVTGQLPPSYSGATVSLPGPAKYKINAWSTARGHVHQCRLDVGQISASRQTPDTGITRVSAGPGFPSAVIIDYNFSAPQLTDTWSHTGGSSHTMVMTVDPGHTYVGGGTEHILIISTTGTSAIDDNRYARVDSVTPTTLSVTYEGSNISGSDSGDITWINTKLAPQHGISVGNWINIHFGSGIGHKIYRIAAASQTMPQTNISPWNNSNAMLFFDYLTSSGDPGLVNWYVLPDDIYFGSSEDPASSVSSRSVVTAIIDLPAGQTPVTLWQYHNADGAINYSDCGIPALSGAPEVYGEISIERIA